MNRLRLAHFLFQILRRLPRKFAVHGQIPRQPFFIIGSGRNGSTMLNRMLNQHQELFLPSEQYFLGPSIFKFHYYNFAIWRDLVKILGGELITSSGSHTWKLDRLPDFLEMYLWPSERKNLQYLLDHFYRHYAAQFGKEGLWGDTTPINSYYLEEIFHTFPEATYFFLIRDGRDVIASYKKGGMEVLGALCDPVNAAHHWMHSIDRYEFLKRKKENVKLVRYEELVQNPELELQMICHELNVEFEPKMLRFFETVPEIAMYQEHVHQNLSKPVFQSSIGNYKNELTDAELKKVIPIIAKGLKQFGYL